MRVLRCTWPLAGALFVTLASTPIAKAEPVAPAPTAEKAAAPTETTFRLFGRTWCIGKAPRSVSCDFTVADERTGPTMTARTSEDKPLDKLMTTLRRLFTGSPTTPATGADNRG